MKGEPFSGGCKPREKMDPESLGIFLSLFGREQVITVPEKFENVGFSPVSESVCIWKGQIRMIHII